MCLTGDKATNVKKEEKIDPRCVVKFRPADGWKGEYGFDWFREGDHGEKNNNGSTSQRIYKYVGKYRRWNEICKNGAIEKLWKQDCTDSNGDFLYDGGDLVSQNYCNGCQVSACQVKTASDFFSWKNKMLWTPIQDEIPMQNDPDFFIDASFRLDSEDTNQNVLKTNCYLEELIKYYTTIDIKDNPDQKYIIPYVSLFSETNSNSTKNRGNYKVPVKLLIKAKAGVCKIVFESSDKGVICLKGGKTEIGISKFEESYEDSVEIALTGKFPLIANKKFFIEVKAVDSEGNKTLAGKICVIKYAPKYVDIVFVPIILRSNRGISLNPLKFLQGLITPSKTQTEKDYLSKFLSHAGIIPNIIIDKDFQKDNYSVVDRIIKSHIVDKGYKDDGGMYILGEYIWIIRKNLLLQRYTKGQLIKIQQELEEEYNKKHTNDEVLKASYKIFLLNIGGCDVRVGNLDDNNNGYYNIDYVYYPGWGLMGQARRIKSKSAIIFDLSSDDVASYPSLVCHELLHCFGLFHSFSNLSDYTFMKYSTSNIMDYSDANEYALQLLSSWRWQWKKIREETEDIRNFKKASFLISPNHV